MRLILKFLVVVLVLGTMQSCVSKKKYDELLSSKEAVDSALADTQSKVQNLEEANADLQKEMASEKERLNGEISGLKTDLQSTQAQVAEVNKKLDMTQKELDAVKAQINGIFASYKESGLSLEQRDGRLYVMTSAATYRSGAYGLSRDERNAISELAETLKSNPSLKILVEGHTDDKKVVAGASYADNWELSSKRALRVVRELIKAGVNPAQVAAVGRGETMPAASNDTSEGRAQNRRSVIVADPDLSNILEGGN